MFLAPSCRHLGPIIRVTSHASGFLLLELALIHGLSLSVVANVEGALPEKTCVETESESERLSVPVLGAEGSLTRGR